MISLALGIGANTAVFSVVDAVFFKPFPIRDPARVVTFVTRHPDSESWLSPWPPRS